MPKILGPFWSYVDKTDYCWLWTGTTYDGYGMYGHKRAHVVAWESVNGPTTDGMVLHHRLLCLKTCVNPEHLTPTTQSEHLSLHNKHTRLNTHCKNGHLYDNYNTAHYNGHRVCKECKRLWSRKHANN